MQQVKSKARAAKKKRPSVRKVEYKNKSETVSRAPKGLAQRSLQRQFDIVFTEYWNALQGKQAAIQIATAESYATFITAVQQAWTQDQVKASTHEACRQFASALKALQDPDSNEEAVEASYQAYEESYRNYVNAIQEAWKNPEPLEQVEQAYLTFTEALQQSQEDTQKLVEEAQQKYLRGLRESWAKVDVAALDEEFIASINQKLMLTIFFTEGIRSDE